MFVFALNLLQSGLNLGVFSLPTFLNPIATSPASLRFQVLVLPVQPFDSFIQEINDADKLLDGHLRRLMSALRRRSAMNACNGIASLAVPKILATGAMEAQTTQYTIGWNDSIIGQSIQQLSCDWFRRSSAFHWQEIHLHDIVMSVILQMDERPWSALWEDATAPVFKFRFVVWISAYRRAW